MASTSQRALPYFYQHARHYEELRFMAGFSHLENSGAGAAKAWISLLVMRGKEFFINRLVKSARRFHPGTTAHGVSHYQLCMTLLETMLLLHARKSGPLDAARLKVLMGVRGHFDEHVMFRQYPVGLAQSVFEALNAEYDRLTALAFRQRYEEFAAAMQATLPGTARGLTLTYLAMFQRLDACPEPQRRADLRDAHGLLFGSVTPQQIDDVLARAAAATIDPRWA